MIRPQVFHAKLADKSVLNQKYTQFFFEIVGEPNRLLFEAGQYVSISIPNADGQRRPYSVSSAPEKDHGFELLVDVVPNGIGVRYLNSLQFGDQIEFLAPLGIFVLPPEIIKSKPVVFVATGAGVAPFRSMILDQLQTQKSTQHITLYLGLRYVEELFWEDEFQELAKDFPNFHFHPVISRPTPEWPLCRGRVTDCLLVHDLTPHAEYYICGSDKMIVDVIQLLEQRGVEKSALHREIFF